MKCTRSYTNIAIFPRLTRFLAPLACVVVVVLCVCAHALSLKPRRYTTTATPSTTRRRPMSPWGRYAAVTIINRHSVIAVKAELFTFHFQTVGCVALLCCANPPLSPQARTVRGKAPAYELHIDAWLGMCA